MDGTAVAAAAATMKLRRVNCTVSSSRRSQLLRIFGKADGERNYEKCIHEGRYLWSFFRFAIGHVSSRPGLISHQPLRRAEHIAAKMPSFPRHLVGPNESFSSGRGSGDCSANYQSMQ